MTALRIIPIGPSPRRVVMVLINAAIGGIVGYTIARLLPPEQSLPTTFGMFVGCVLWLIREMRRLRNELRSVYDEIDRLQNMATPIVFLDAIPDDPARKPS